MNRNEWRRAVHKLEGEPKKEGWEGAESEKSQKNVLNDVFEERYEEDKARTTADVKITPLMIMALIIESVRPMAKQIYNSYVMKEHVPSAKVLAHSVLQNAALGLQLNSERAWPVFKKSIEFLAKRMYLWGQCNPAELEMYNINLRDEIRLMGLQKIHYDEHPPDSVIEKDVLSRAGNFVAKEMLDEFEVGADYWKGLSLNNDIVPWFLQFAIGNPEAQSFLVVIPTQNSSIITATVNVPEFDPPDSFNLAQYAKNFQPQFFDISSPFGSFKMIDVRNRFEGSFEDRKAAGAS